MQVPVPPGKRGYPRGGIVYSDEEKEDEEGEEDEHEDEDEEKKE